MPSLSAESSNCEETEMAISSLLSFKSQLFTLIGAFYSETGRPATTVAFACVSCSSELSDCCCSNVWSIWSNWSCLALTISTSAFCEAASLLSDSTIWSLRRLSVKITISRTYLKCLPKSSYVLTVV